MESEIRPKVQKLVEYFDTECERLLEFDKPLDRGKTPKEYLNDLITNENGWNKIAATCRRMIICDRELDLEKGTELMKNTIDAFNELNHGDQPYEAIRYFNTCGLISYRCGDYSRAKNHFELAKELTEKIPSMNPFVPDLTSNIIRTSFEFFSHTLPSKGIEIGDVDYYVRRFEDFIKEYKDALIKSYQYYKDDEKLNLIYGHGMASLYHNLGDCYYILFKKLKTVDKPKAYDALNESERCHRQSLKYGEKVDDEYRKLQSKRYLSVLDSVDASERKHYEDDVLKGKWVRGRQIVYQNKIRESTNIEEINDIIKELRLDKNEKDKILLLYNYEAIKTAINNNNNVKSILDKNAKELTSLDIAKAKIDVAERIRTEFYLLYRRQAINLVRDDVLEIIEDCWKKGNYKEVINWGERYSCRGLIELSQISLDRQLELTDIQKKKINELKKPIFDEDIRQLNEHSIGIAPSISSTIGDLSELNKHSKKNLNIPLSLTLGTKNYDNFLDLIIAYESVLEQPSKDFQPPKQEIYKELMDLLIKIPDEEKTAVLKFFTFEQGKQKKKMGRAFLIKKEEYEKVMEFELDFVNDAIDILDKINLYIDIGVYPKDNYEQLVSIIHGLFNKLELEKELDDVKNLFIIPDGELFQLPLHSMFKEIQGLNVYYSPTITHLLTMPDRDTIKSNKEANYLWVQCPATGNLCVNCKPILNHPKCNDIKTLQCENANLESFFESYKSNIYTHIGFSTHGFFHNHSKDAYISQILFNNSFLTPYDILFQLDFSGVQTIFLGCCEIGSSTYTDENEAIGLVTAFMAKKAVSVIASLWKIDSEIHDNFIRAVDKSGIANYSEAWNLAEVLGGFKDIYESIPFVQYASISIVVKRLPKEAQQEILSCLQDDPLTYN